MRRTWAWLRMLGGFAILGVLLWQLGTSAFLDGLSRVDLPGIFAALAIGLATTVCSAWRWVLVARRLRLRIALPAAVGDYYRALFLNSVLPAGVLGDVHRAVQHGREAGDVGRGVRAVVLERFAGQVVVIAAAVLVVLTWPDVVPGAFTGVVTACGIVVAVLAVAICFAAPMAGRRWAHSSSRWHRGVADSVADVRIGLLSRRSGPGVLALSVLVFAGHVALFVVAARIAGVTAPVTTLLPLAVLALTAMGLPLNVGGWGPREGVCALAFAAAGLGAAQGVTVAVVYGVLAFVAGLPGAGVLLTGAIAGLRTRETAEKKVSPVLPSPRVAGENGLWIRSDVPADVVPPSPAQMGTIR